MASKLNAAVKASKDETVRAVMDQFEWAYTKSVDDLRRLEEIQAVYDNVVDSDNWPTKSKMPIPMMFSATERAIPTALDYLFTNSKFLRLLPTRHADLAATKKVEDFVRHVVLHRMRLRNASVRSLKDCFKLGIGYGIVEQYAVTPFAPAEKSIVRGSRVVAKTKIMEKSPVAQSALRFRYLSPAQVIVTPDGAEPNGDLAPTARFVLDSLTEEQVRDLYRDSPDGVMLGNVDAIITEARSFGFRANVPIVSMIAALAGYDIQLAVDEKNKHIPVRVPVLKAYLDKRHIWIANGLTVIYDNQQYQSLLCPVIKASAWPDGMRWYPMSAVEAAVQLSVGYNLWFNLMLDLMTQVLTPTIVYNKDLIKKIQRGPGSDLGVAGPVKDNIDYLRPPEIPEALMVIGGAIETQFGQAMGQSSVLNNPQSGLMRGGAFAFESLLQSISGRERLSSTILETNFLYPLIVQTMIYLQVMAGGAGLKYNTRTQSARGKESIETHTVTEDDLLNAYDVQIDLREKHRNSALDQMARIQMFNTLRDDPYTDQYELRQELLQYDELANRLLFPREEAEKIQAERAELENEAIRLNINTKRAQPAGQAQSTAIDQAAAGAAQMGGGA